MKSWSFTKFIRMLEQHGFVMDKQKGAVQTYVGMVDGKTRVVAVHFHHGGDDIKLGTLASMIRKSGLGKKLFR